MPLTSAGVARAIVVFVPATLKICRILFIAQHYNESDITDRNKQIRTE